MNQTKKMEKMKRHLLMLSGAFLLAHAAFGQITNPTPYCAAGYDDYDGNFAVPHYISNVSLGTLNNTSGTTQYPAPHYAYYNSLPAKQTGFHPDHQYFP